MTHFIKKVTSLSVIIALTSITSMAQAKTEYHVYKKGSSCEIDMRTPDKFISQRGSSWKFIGKDTTRSGAKKVAKKSGC